MPRSRSWRAAVEATGRARRAWEQHKEACESCAARDQRPCEAGRDLLHALWACHGAQSDAWHAKPPKFDMEALF